MTNIPQQEVWDSIQQDHSPDALRVWSDYFKEQGLEREGEILLWYADKTDRWPRLWGEEYKWSWYINNHPNKYKEVECDIFTEDFVLLHGKSYNSTFRAYDYPSLKEALEDFYEAAHTCKTCIGTKVVSEVTFTPQPMKKCPVCKGTGKRR